MVIISSRRLRPGKKKLRLTKSETKLAKRKKLSARKKKVKSKRPAASPKKIKKIKEKKVGSLKKQQPAKALPKPKKLKRSRKGKFKARRKRPAKPTGPVWIPPTSDRLIICSVTSASNLHRAKVMARSVKTFEPSSKIIICLVEENMNEHAYSPHVDHWVLAKDLGVPFFHRNMFKYNINEGTTSMKAATVKYAMNLYPEDSLFVYLDTDMRVYYPMTDLKERMKEHPIWLTPHVLTTSRHMDSYLHDGIFNSGILGLTRSEQMLRFLDWWDNKLYEACYFDDRLFADQGWLDFAPLYFDAQTLRHPGYNMAAWNIGETGRDITHTENGYYYIYDKPLVAFHYSGLHWGNLQKNLRERYPDGNNILYRMLDEYFLDLDEMGKKQVSGIPWSYDYFNNGEFIKQETKDFYKRNLEKFADIENLFGLTNDYFAQYKQQA